MKRTAPYVYGFTLNEDEKSSIGSENLSKNDLVNLFNTSKHLDVFFI
ncbi:hypothetical protein [Peribacillus butanolivorans]